MTIDRSRTALCTFALAISGGSLSLAGCHRPEGGMMSYTGETQTYYSTEMSPKTITVVDTRTNETLHEFVVPVGKQFVYDFVKDGGNDPVQTPDLMRYDIMPLGAYYGRLRNGVTVPNQYSRRVDFYIREGVEYAEEPPSYRLRPESLEEQPAWWTPEGGPMGNGEETKTTMYDG